MRLGLFVALATLVLALDQWVKHWVVQHMVLHAPGEPFLSLPGTAYGLALTYTQNFGAAWSIFWGQQGLLIAIAAVESLAIVAYALWLKQRDWGQMIGLGLLLGGALGNLIDRSRLGFVVDMFDLQRAGANVFPIFNVADIGIDVGVALLVAHGLWSHFTEGRGEAATALPQA